MSYLLTKEWEFFQVLSVWVEGGVYAVVFGLSYSPDPRECNARPKAQQVTGLRHNPPGSLWVSAGPWRQGENTIGVGSAYHAHKAGNADTHARANTPSPRTLIVSWANHRRVSPFPPFSGVKVPHWEIRKIGLGVEVLC